MDVLEFPYGLSLGLALSVSPSHGPQSHSGRLAAAHHGGPLLAACGGLHQVQGFISLHDSFCRAGHHFAFDLIAPDVGKPDGEST